MMQGVFIPQGAIFGTSFMWQYLIALAVGVLVIVAFWRRVRRSDEESRADIWLMILGTLSLASVGVLAVIDAYWKNAAKDEIAQEFYNEYGVTLQDSTGELNTADILTQMDLAGAIYEGDRPRLNSTMTVSAWTSVYGSQVTGDETSLSIPEVDGVTFLVDGEPVTGDVEIPESGLNLRAERDPAAVPVMVNDNGEQSSGELLVERVPGGFRVWLDREEGDSR